MVYANFKAHAFSYLNTTSMDSEHVLNGSECGFACVSNPSCSSFNLAAFHDGSGKLLCEFLPSDVFNNSDKFIISQSYHHFSITVSEKFVSGLWTQLEKSCGLTRRDGLMRLVTLITSPKQFLNTVIILVIRVFELHFFFVCFFLLLLFFFAPIQITMIHDIRALCQRLSLFSTLGPIIRCGSIKEPFP